MKSVVVFVCMLVCGAVPTRALNGMTQQQGAGVATSEDGDNVAPLDRRVTLQLRDVPVVTAVRAIDEQARLRLNYSERMLPAAKRVTLVVDHMPAKTALAKALEGTGLAVRKTGAGDLLLERDQDLRGAERADTATGPIIGRITDSTSKEPIEGALVTVEGTALRAVTGKQGRYGIANVPAGMHTVVARHLGYRRAEREVLVVENEMVPADFALQMGMARLQDVVVTPTGPQRRYELGNDITILNADSIVATQPVMSVTDILEGRVPGLVVQHTSGAPGDPSRLRLRGAGSALRSNDPIVVVDGIRVYYAQSDSTSGNLARFDRIGTSVGNGIPAPSPLDQIDPHSIETIEVLKGPSAATLYGPDAANGVIVITTKRGQPGPARWTASVSRGMTYMPGKYPDGIYRWGTSTKTDIPQLCTLTDFDCQPDGGLVRFQALNDPKYTVLGRGANTAFSLGASGGTSDVTYALTGSYADETGLLALPDVEAEHFQAQHGAAPPSWMQRPQRHKRWSGTSRLTGRLGAHIDASLSTMLTREWQQRSSLDRALGTLMGTYVDPVTGIYWRGIGGQSLASGTSDMLIPDFYQRATDQATNFTNAVALTWRPKAWLTTSAQAGLNVISRHDEVFLPRQMVTANADSAGRLGLGDGTAVLSTVNLNAVATAPLPWGSQLRLAVGANYSNVSNKQLATQVRDLPAGTSSLNGAGEIVNSGQVASDVTSFGWFVEPSFTHRRFIISTGMRFDGSSSFGAQATLPVFPKVGVSWLLSDEPFFPSPLKHVFDALRVRAAYGQAGVWPGPADKLRLYRTSRPFLDSALVDVNQISTLGNSRIRPERSSEMESGFDADFFDDRLSVGLTGYRKMRYDALMRAPVAPSVYGPDVTILRNVGIIRNTGVELHVSTQLVRTDPVTWSTMFDVSRNRNLVTKLGEGVEPFFSIFGDTQTRIAPGYPLFGQWAKPILGYADVNGNGIIEVSEVQIGDTAVFMGETVPNYQVNVSNTFSFFRGAVTASATLNYQNGLTQSNGWTGRRSNVDGSGSFFVPAVSDPAAPFSEQAAVAIGGRTKYGLLQTVSTLRLGSISVAFNVAPSLAQRFGAGALSIAVQGTNLGLWTNYRGKDPNVNAFATGNAVTDTGILPVPRQWRLSVRTSY